MNSSIVVLDIKFCPSYRIRSTSVLWTYLLILATDTSIHRLLPSSSSKSQEIQFLLHVFVSFRIFANPARRNCSIPKHVHLFGAMGQGFHAFIQALF